MHALHAAATGTEHAELHTFPKATHNDIFETGGRKYWEAKRDFLQKVIKGI